MKPPRILIAGIGNIFLGDDAFGVEVARRLANRSLPAAVRLVDFGIRSLDLAYEMVGGYEAVILVDAVARGGQPGDLYLIEAEPDGETAEGLDAHTMHPEKSLRFARSLGGPLPPVFIVGCEATPLDPDDVPMALSEPVERRLDEAADLVESLIERLLAEGPGHRIESLLPSNLAAGLPQNTKAD